jgi:hypothetical protein
LAEQRAGQPAGPQPASPEALLFVQALAGFTVVGQLLDTS